MSIIFAIIFLTAYLATGVQVARVRYGLDYRKYDAIKGGQDDNYNKLQNKELAIKKMGHASWCYLEWDLLREKGCNCEHKDKWWSLRNDIKSIKREGFVSPAEVSYSTLAFWPLWFITQYIQKLKPEHQIVQGEVVDVTDEFDAPILGYRAEIERDPLYQEITQTWAELEAKAKADMEAESRPKVSAGKSSGRTKSDYDRYYRKSKKYNDYYDWKY